MKMGPGIAEIGGLIGDPVRAAMLAVLMDGRALPAGELAFIGNVAPQTASFHLGKLREAALISVERQGKHSYYRLANEAVAFALESMAALAPLQNRVSQPESHQHREHAKSLRFARSCYRHLAGRLAVDLHQTLVSRKLLIFGEGGFGEGGAASSRECRLTEAGRSWWSELGVPLAGTETSRSHTGSACLDWTERHHHLGGPLGVGLFSRMKELSWLAPMAGTRAVRLTHTGQRELQRRLGMKIVVTRE